MNPHTKQKWYLAAFLNLLVLPGTGSLVLGKRFAGFTQLFLSFLGMALFAFSFKSVIGWGFDLFSRFNKNYHPLGWYEGDIFFWGSSPKALVFIDYLLLALERGNIPMCWGVSSLTLFLLALGIFLFVWIYSLISLIEKEKK